jgi:cellulose synthase/poly-beta-1,6-N-acetylglucosamine synthase-like glycosyltransferase
MSDFELGLSLLLGQSASSLAAIFWYTILFEIPRYAFPLVAIALVQFAAAMSSRQRFVAPLAQDPSLKVSVVVVGHNEADSLEACVRSLREQSFNKFEIVIVSDGSSDATAAGRGAPRERRSCRQRPGARFERRQIERC